MTGPVAHIDLDALVANWRMLARRAEGAQAAAVVKAGAYGLGVEPVAKALARAGCRRFYVAWPDEGAAVRKVLGAGPEIAVFHGPGADSLPVFSRHALEPVLNSPDQIALWLSAGIDAPASLHVDTGMNRLGVSPADWSGAAQVMKTPHRLVSHLACGDDPAHEMNNRQLQLFGEAAHLWPGAKRSLSATAGVYLGPAYTLDEIRPGIGLYGGGPRPASGEAPRPVLRLVSPILQVRDIGAGEPAGYGASWTAPRACTLATVGLGYADGFIRAASNKGHGVLHGSRRPIVGRVSMDLVILDVTGVDAKPGDEVEFLGAEMPLGEQADAMGTIDYEILTRLSSRARRVWTGAE